MENIKMMRKKKRSSLSLTKTRTSPRWHRASVPSNTVSSAQPSQVPGPSYSAMTPIIPSSSSQHLEDTPPPGASPSLPTGSSPSLARRPLAVSRSSPIEQHIDNFDFNILSTGRRDASNLVGDNPKDTDDFICKQNDTGDFMGDHEETTGGGNKFKSTGDDFGKGQGSSEKCEDVQIDDSQSTSDCVHGSQDTGIGSDGCQEHLDNYQDSLASFQATEDSTADFPDFGDFLVTDEEIEAQLSAALASEYCETDLIHRLPPSSHQLTSRRKPSGVKKQTSLLSFMTSRVSINKGKGKVEFPSKDTQPQNGRKDRESPSVGSKRQRRERGGRAPEQMDSSSGEKGHRKRACPFYKKIPGTPFTVDAFRYGSIPNCTAYFLTHFHSDHYMGLRKSFQHPIYCSKVTGNLVKQQLKVSEEWVHPLPLNDPVIIEQVQVTFLEANHCPGAVLILFSLLSGQNYLHTGDFRFSSTMLEYPPLVGLTIHQLYLDTTYCDPLYTFPPQEEVIAFAVDKCLNAVQACSRTLIVCGSYTIGKEKVFTALADVLGVKICVSRDKKAVLDCLESSSLSRSLTTDYSQSCIHVLPMAKLNMRDLAAHLESWRESYSQLLAFKPTGWTHASGRGASKGSSDLASIQPYTRGPVTIYGIPYSEHSSYDELRQCVQGWRPRNILPTVNNFSATKRDQMQRTFQKWLSETGEEKGSKPLVQTKLWRT